MEMQLKVDYRILKLLSLFQMSTIKYEKQEEYNEWLMTSDGVGVDQGPGRGRRSHEETRS